MQPGGRSQKSLVVFSFKKRPREKYEKEEEEEKVCKKDERWTIIMRRSREMNEGL
jgi:hypothetical protein